MAIAVTEELFDTASGTIRCLLNRGEPDGRPAAVLIHGSGGQADAWRPVLEQLALVSAVAVDMPGHGGSSGRPLTSVAECSQFVDVLRQRLGLDRIVVVGQSLGGAVAQQYAYDHPGACAGIVVANSAPDFHISDARIRDIKERWLETAEAYAAGQVSPRAGAALKQAALAMVRARNPDTFIADLEVCNGFNSRAWAGQIAVPVVIVAGHDDTLAVPARSLALLELIAHAEMVMFSPCGHCTMLEQPYRFAAEIERFSLGCLGVQPACQ